MRKYAERTSVPIDRTRNEIEQLITRHGATGFVYGSANNQALIMFEMRERRLKFLVPMAVQSRKLDERATAAENRRRWRAMLLVLKAKLEAVASQIVLFDEEFLAHIVVEGNATVGDRILPGLHGAIANGGQLPPLLLGSGPST